MGNLKLLNKQDTVRQSTDCYRQWKKTWHEHAKINGEIVKKRNMHIRDIFSFGINRCSVHVAMGQSLENHIDMLKKYQRKIGVDIISCDTAFGVLVERDIKPKVIIVSDAVVDYDLWAKPWIDKSEDVILISSATANPKWIENWKGPTYLVVCKDAIGTEKIIGEISGVDDYFPAAANVANAQIVYATLIMAYSTQLLVGYDYSWKPYKNYYAFSEEKSEEKRFWQKGGYTLGIDHEFTYQSENLKFAARWLNNFYWGKIATLPIKFYNCSGQGIVDINPANLERCLENYEYITPSATQIEGINKSRVRTIEKEIDEKTNIHDIINQVMKGNKINKIYFDGLPRRAIC